MRAPRGGPGTEPAALPAPGHPPGTGKERGSACRHGLLGRAGRQEGLRGAGGGCPGPLRASRAVPPDVCWSCAGTDILVLGVRFRATESVECAQGYSQANESLSRWLQYYFCLWFLSPEALPPPHCLGAGLFPLSHFYSTKCWLLLSHEEVDFSPRRIWGDLFGFQERQRDGLKNVPILLFAAVCSKTSTRLIF